MVALSYIVIGAVFSTVLVGILSHHFMRRRDEEYMERFDAHRRSSRDARELAISKLSETHSERMEAMAHKFNVTRDKLESALMAFDAADSANQDLTVERLSLEGEIEELRARLAAAPSPRSTRNDTRTIERLYYELGSTQRTLEAVELRMSEVRRLAARGEDDAREERLGQWSALRLFEDIASTIASVMDVSGR
tara:strand:+ start:966 stop:1547 length:582 start_codon:yes stop_codon:yes gene_type:complete